MGLLSLSLVCLYCALLFHRFTVAQELLNRFSKTGKKSSANVFYSVIPIQVSKWLDNCAEKID